LFHLGHLQQSKNKAERLNGSALLFI